MKIITKEKSFIIETPFVLKIISVLSLFYPVDRETLKINFLINLNLFKNATFSSFVKIWTNSIFGNWKFYFMILIENLLILVPFPSKLKYGENKHLLNTSIYKLNSFKILS